MLIRWKIADRCNTGVFFIPPSSDMIFKVYDGWEGSGTSTQSSSTTAQPYKWE